MMTYSEAVEFLFSRLPMFQRMGAAAYKNDLSNTIALCEALNHPERGFKSIHVAGTNGKGSVCSTLAAIFAENGYKTGLFTSPHLKDFRERIRINGQMVPEAFVVGFVDKTAHLVDHLQPSFFELTCCMAFDYFRTEKVDIAIVEVGMGGRLDSTNVVLPELAVITSIGIDHQQFLGDTLVKIAVEKGGIIKPEVPVVISENEPEVVEVLTAIAKERNAPCILVNDDDAGLATDLGGVYQAENMRTVQKAIGLMRARGWKLEAEAVKVAALNVVALSGLRGRWEVLNEAPKVIADVGHNEEGVAMVVQMLSEERYDHLHVVWGMVSDKDASRILRLLPTHARYYWCKPGVPRGKDVHELQEQAAAFGLQGANYPSVQAALASAKTSASERDLIFVGGSVFVVAEVI